MLAGVQERGKLGIGRPALLGRHLELGPPCPPAHPAESGRDDRDPDLAGQARIDGRAEDDVGLVRRGLAHHLCCLVDLDEREVVSAGDREEDSARADDLRVDERGILLSIAGGDDLTLLEVNEAAEVVRQAATDDTNIIFGATVDERLTGQVWVTVVATGIGGPRRSSYTPSFPAVGASAGVSGGRGAEREGELPSFLR